MNAETFLQLSDEERAMGREIPFVQGLLDVLARRSEALTATAMDALAGGRVDDAKVAAGLVRGFDTVRYLVMNYRRPVEVVEPEEPFIDPGMPPSLLAKLAQLTKETDAHR